MGAYVEGRGKEEWQVVAEKLGIEGDTDEFVDVMKSDKERGVL